VVVRRRAGLAALIGAAASAVAIAYLWRASQTMTGLDWFLCAAMALVAGYYLTTLVDARNPLAVADELGVRIRLGDEWRGLPWDGIRQVTVHPRRGPLRDGRIVFTPHTPARVVDGLEGRAKRHAGLNQKLYGAALAVPVGVMTRVSTSGEHSVVDQIAALSLGRAEVIEVASEDRSEQDSAVGSGTPPKDERRQERQRARELSRDKARKKARDRARETAQDKADRRTQDAAARADRDSKYPDRSSQPEDQQSGYLLSPEHTTGSLRSHGSPAEAQIEQPARRRILGGLATIVSRVGKSRRPEADGAVADGVVADVPLDPAARTQPAGSGQDEAASPGGSLPLRSTRRALRAEVTRDVPATLGNAAHEADDTRSTVPESRELRRPGSVNLVFEPALPARDARVRPISQLGDPVEPLVIDDFATEPAYDPVIGPELTAARTRLGLSVDELADRTRIRPHVIESIEVDDFAPCGGDFYARGHLRTIARFLGKDAAPFLTAFEERYATAPVNARRVFEAELATGMRGSMRSTVGGPNWGLLIGVVLSLVLVWGVVRFFSAEPAELVQSPAPVLNGSAGLGSDPRPGAVAAAAKPLRLTLVAAFAGSKYVVRDGDGRIVFTGELRLGEKRRLEAVPPVRVAASDAGAVEVSVQGRDKGVLGVLGEPGMRTFR